MMHDAFPHRPCPWVAPHDWDTLDVRATVPDEPGYYVFTNHAEQLLASGAEKNVLYIGMAARSLRERIQRYRGGENNNLAPIHAGAFLLFLSRASAVHATEGNVYPRLQAGIQRRPIDVTIQRAGGGIERYQIAPSKIYLRWAVDTRAAIERLLIRDLHPKYNSVHTRD